MSKIIKKDGYFRIYDATKQLYFKKKFRSEIETALYAKKASYGKITIKNYEKQWIKD